MGSDELRSHSRRLYFGISYDDESERGLGNRIAFIFFLIGRSRNELDDLPIFSKNHLIKCILIRDIFKMMMIFYFF